MNPLYGGYFRPWGDRSDGLSYSQRLAVRRKQLRLCLRCGLSNPRAPTKTTCEPCAKLKVAKDQAAGTK
jgi:hypothetical protein